MIKLKKYLFAHSKRLSFGFALFLCPVYALAETSISQHGITWKFDKDYVVGTFVNGDYYVVDNGAGVRVVSVTPAPGKGNNGSILNPTVGSKHPFDSDVREGYDESLAVRFPVTLKAGDALISTESLTSQSSGWDDKPIDSKVKVNSAAVLTVLGKAPPPGTFRPSYVDREQTLYNFSNVKKSKLPRLATAGISSPPSHGFNSALDYLKRGLQRPWILFVHEWPSRDIHPAQNMPGYHMKTGEFLSELYTYLVSDQPVDDQLLIYTVQLGIDYHKVGMSGNGDGSYYTMPSLVAGFLMNNDAMLNAFKRQQIQSVPRDYEDFYLWQERRTAQKSATIREGQTWNGFSVFFRNNLGENREYEHLHPSEWDDALWHWKDDSYRLHQDSHPNVGMVLAARILGLQEQWNHDATFAYVDRWMVEDHIANARVLTKFGGTSDGKEVKRSGSPFIDEMWAKYRQNQPRRPEAPSIISVVPARR